MSRFVDDSATDEVTLSNGDKVWIRQRLTAPEQAALTRSLVTVQVDTATMQAREIAADWTSAYLGIVRAYLVNWNFRDDSGNAVPFSRPMIEKLDEDTVNEIARAIDVAQKTRKVSAEKNASTS